VIDYIREQSEPGSANELRMDLTLMETSMITQLVTQGTSGSPDNLGRVRHTSRRSPAGRQQCTTRCEVKKIARDVGDSNVGIVPVLKPSKGPSGRPYVLAREGPSGSRRRLIDTPGRRSLRGRPRSGEARGRRSGETPVKAVESEPQKGQPQGSLQRSTC
jgi:hypothetical protein